MSETSGLADLLPFLGDRPALALLAIKAPAGQVTGALVDTYGPRVVEDAPVRAARDEPLAVDDWIAVVRIRDEAWTLVYRAFEPIGEAEWRELVDDGMDVVTTLATEAVLVGLGGEDGIGRAAVLRAEADQPDDDADHDLVVEQACWRDGVFDLFESRLREGFADAGEPVPQDFTDRLFRDRGIWAAPCWPHARGDEAWLDVAEVDPTRIERVDLLDLGTRAAYDEETLEMHRESLVDDLRDVILAAESSAEEAATDEPAAEDAMELEADDEAPVAAETTLGAAGDARAEPEAVDPPDPSAESEPRPSESKLRGFFARLVGRG